MYTCRTCDIQSTVVEPGNGTRYAVVWGNIDLGNGVGQPFIALPDFNVSATMSITPVEAGYIASKLGISLPDAEVVLAVLNGELR